MIIVVTKEGKYRLHWTGKDWRDESGELWKQGAGVHDEDFISKRHGIGVVSTEDPFRPPARPDQTIVREIRTNFNKRL